MPLYEYRCLKCGKRFEMLQSIRAEPLKRCIHCEGPVEKEVSQSSFQLKGSGWYVTDYQRKGGKKAGEGKNSPPDGAAK